MENIATQVINVKVLDNALLPNVPGTGFETIFATVDNSVNSHLVIILGAIFVVGLFLLAFILYRRLNSLKILNSNSKKEFDNTNKRAGITVGVLITAILAIAGITTHLVRANASTILDSETLNVTIAKPNLSTTTSDTLSVTTDTIAHNLTAAIDSISDSRINVKINGHALSSLATTLATDSISDSYNLDYIITISSSLPIGDYTAYINYNVEEIDDPLLVPTYECMTQSSNIVPCFASTIAPSGNGSGTNGPQFSIYINLAIPISPTPTVTIGGQPCTDVVVNSAGTAITCTGPTSGMTDGEKRVVINGTDMGDATTVWYSSYSFPTLQSLTTTGTCLGTPTTPVIYRDSRDSQLYYVAKLKDNKCWMLDNLRYKPNGDTIGTVTNSFSATQVASIGTYLTNNGTNIPNSNDPNIDAALYVDPITDAYCRNNTNKSPQNITKCGLLYNFYTVNAGTALRSQTAGESSGSICPTNWHLPTGRNASGDYGVLDSAYGGTGTGGSSTPQLATLWLSVGDWRGLFSGYYSNTFSLQGTLGWYWTSSISSATGGHALSFRTSLVNPGTNFDNRYYGLAVRCVN